MSNWHSRPVAELLDELTARPTGLSTKQGEERLQQHGANELSPPPRPSLFMRILKQMKDPMILVLLAAAALSFGASGGEDWLDGAIILLIVVVNNFISISQEDNAERALLALQKMTAPMATALRDGRKTKLESARLVPGDVIFLEAGDMVPADCRLLELAGLKTDESSMTGESLPVEKILSDTLPQASALGDWTNMVLSGTLVVGGRGAALVVATGMNTQMGHIAGLLLHQQSQPTPLQVKMSEISKMLSFICLCVCAVMFAVGLLQGKDLLDMFLTAVSLAVAAIPEGLPAIVTIVLALGVGRMAERGAIVKTLPAVETLGCASVICSDKTGTLTQNKMTVQDVWIPSGGHRRDAMVCGTLCSDAHLEWRAGAPIAVGDPTENALVIAAARDGVDQLKLSTSMPRIGEIPFDSTRKLMSTLHSVPDGGCLVLVKGAPDVLLRHCTHGGRGELTPAQRQHITTTAEEMAGRALRVIGVAQRELQLLPHTISPKIVEEKLTFLGLFGMSDPPRLEVRDAVLSCHRAGVRPVMITGDHKATAVAIARTLNIYRSGDLAITGSELDFMPQEILEADIAKFSVFARVTPEHKMRIVQAWQKQNQIVAMSGDGLNDAPALKAADMGCAMGIAGTDVAKGAADMILTDDNFSTIVYAVEEGRGIYSNITKAIHYLLSCNIGEIITIFTATALNFSQMPLIPVQLLWLNLVTDSLPALALGVEPVEPGVMDLPPRSADEGLFNRAFSLRLLWQGTMVGALTLTAYFLGMFHLGAAGMEGAIANTMAFSTLTLSQLFHAFSVRSEDKSLFSIGILSNPAMNRAFLVGLALQLSVLLLPPMQVIFSVVPMNLTQWMTVMSLAIAPIPICEMVKAMHHTPKRKQSDIDLPKPEPAHLK